MTAYAVGNRIAIDLDSLDIPVSRERIVDILKEKHIRPIEVDIAPLAKSLIGKARWKWASRQWEAPYFFDCSSLVKWLYGQKGLWLPRRSLQLVEFCQIYGSIHSRDEINETDLLFLSSPYKDGVRTDSDEGIGHVCIASGNNRVICATNSELGTGIVEISIDILLRTRTLCAVGRPYPSLSLVTTFIVPPEREIETPDDVRCIILQSL